MDNDFWQQKWATQDIKFNQSEPNVLLKKFFPELNIKIGKRVFVPLCGKSVDMLWLIEMGYQIIGVELSDVACYAFFEEQGISFKVHQSENFKIFEAKQITIFSGDFFLLNRKILGLVDAVYDRAALIALPEVLRKKYAEHMKALLEPHTKILLITTEYDQNEMVGPPFSVGYDEVKNLFATFCEIQQLYHKPIKEIPQHLHAKGLQYGIEQVYCLTLS